MPSNAQIIVNPISVFLFAHNWGVNGDQRWSLVLRQNVRMSEYNAPEQSAVSIEFMQPESLPPPVSTAAPRTDFRELWSIRAALWFLHLTVVVAASSSTPGGYYFQLGEYTGPALLFSSVILWWFLLSAETI
jgi:hypothetical protein